MKKHHIVIVFIMQNINVRINVDLNSTRDEDTVFNDFRSCFKNKYKFMYNFIRIRDRNTCIEKALYHKNYYF